MEILLSNKKNQTFDTQKNMENLTDTRLSQINHPRKFILYDSIYAKFRIGKINLQ